MPCLYCRKMCCLNGSRKLHFVQKIRLDRIIKYLGPDGFFARSAIFCRYWTCTFSCRNNQAIGAEVVCIFTFFYMPNGNGNKKCRNSHQRIAAGCPTETRTQSNRTKIWCATITPWGNRNFAGAKVRTNSDISKFFGENFGSCLFFLAK